MDADWSAAWTLELSFIAFIKKRIHNCCNDIQAIMMS